jgi:hypothetical protein
MSDRTTGGYCIRCLHSTSDGHCAIEETIAEIEDIGGYPLSTLGITKPCPHYREVAP